MFGGRLWGVWVRARVLLFLSALLVGGLTGVCPGGRSV